jgi:hypothetical protein
VGGAVVASRLLFPLLSFRRTLVRVSLYRIWRMVQASLHTCSILLLLSYESPLAGGAVVASRLLFPSLSFCRTMVQASLYACSPLPYLSSYDGAGVAPHLLYPSSFVV